VVITGGSRGLGLALAQEFGACGTRLVLAARDFEELQRGNQILVKDRAMIREEDVLLFPCDLTKPGQAEALIAQATAQFGQVDVLINCAGVIHVGPAEKHPLSNFREAMEINFFATLEATYAVLPQMLERADGSIVNITSIGGKVPVPHLAPYSASKFAAVGFSETLNTELRSKGIRVTTVCPGLMRTGSFPNAKLVGDHQKEYSWFSAGATAPLVSNSVQHAARTIRRATEQGRTEITIGPEAFLAARFSGLAPETTQYLAHVANRLVLPRSKGSSETATAHHLPPPHGGWWQKFTNVLTSSQNQPEV
jgi:short-subunit dehydrogenase